MAAEVGYSVMMALYMALLAALTVSIHMVIQHRRTRHRLRDLTAKKSPKPVNSARRTATNKAAAPAVSTAGVWTAAEAWTANAGTVPQNRCKRPARRKTHRPKPVQAQIPPLRSP